VSTLIKEIAMKQLVLVLLVLGLVGAVSGAAAGNTEEQDVAFEVDMTTETVCFSGDYDFDVRPGDSIVFTWTARDSAPEAETTDAENNLYPLFGGSGIYPVPGIYTIPPDIPEGTYYLRQIGGTVRGRINVKRT
jgi:hypothetical protein